MTRTELPRELGARYIFMITRGSLLAETCTSDLGRLRVGRGISHKQQLPASREPDEHEELLNHPDGTGGALRENLRGGLLASPLAKGDSHPQSREPPPSTARVDHQSLVARRSLAMRDGIEKQTRRDQSTRLRRSMAPRLVRLARTLGYRGKGTAS